MDFAYNQIFSRVIDFCLIRQYTVDYAAFFLRLEKCKKCVFVVIRIAPDSSVQWRREVMNQ